MTSPAIETASIEHLDHRPACGTKRHTADRPPAAYWVSLHGCDDGLFCRACFTRMCQTFEARVAALGYVRCFVCLERFSVFEETYEVRPL